MKLESFCLSDEPFSSSFDILFPFPEDEKGKIIEAMESIDDSIIQRQIENSREDILERTLAEKIDTYGYIYSKDYPDACRLWLPDYRNEADFYNPKKKIAIEVEKTEKKRIVHDVLKLINGSMTFTPKILYGVLIFPDIYRRKSGKKSNFLSTVKRELPFYFQRIIPDLCNLHDVLVISYKTS